MGPAHVQANSLNQLPVGGSAQDWGHPWLVGALKNVKFSGTQMGVSTIVGIYLSISPISVIFAHMRVSINGGTPR